MTDRMFKVRLNTYKEYYVLAKSFDKAALKAIEKYEEEKSAALTGGSPSFEFQSDKPVYVQTIDYLSESLVK